MMFLNYIWSPVSDHICVFLSRWCCQAIQVFLSFYSPCYFPKCSAVTKISDLFLSITCPEILYYLCLIALNSLQYLSVYWEIASFIFMFVHCILCICPRNISTASRCFSACMLVVHVSHACNSIALYITVILLFSRQLTAFLLVNILSILQKAR